LVLDTLGASEAASALGARVRSLRRQRGMTLKDLGRKAGLSHPFLSQVERGLARPSLGSAERIAEALDVPVATLWTPSARSGHATIVRRDAGEQSKHFDCSAPGAVRTLAADGVPLRVSEWTGGSRRWPDESSVEPGAVILYVARGAIAVELGGDEHVLQEGDTMLFDGTVPHRMRRTGGVSTRVVRVSAPLPAF
jgi:transcriptional regulator with XRE-family HTH domain